MSIDEGSPFHPDNAAGLNLVMQMRIYDVLMGILDLLEDDYQKRHGGKDRTTSDLIYEAHASGRIVSELPYFDPGEEENE
jgi:hypothetical protein